MRWRFRSCSAWQRSRTWSGPSSFWQGGALRLGAGDLTQRIALNRDDEVGHLVDNAVKFMDKTDGRVKIGCLEQGSLWRFSVSDNEPGIDGRYHEKIFQILQTLSPRDVVESTGVGLSLVKKIVEGAGGRVWVESQVGRGGTFFFTLPRGKEGELTEVRHNDALG